MQNHNWFLSSFSLDRFLKFALFFPPKRALSKFLCDGDTVVEIGCGKGHLTIPIAETIGPGGRVYATDSDEKSIEMLRTKARKKGYEKIIESKVTSPADLTFIPDSSVDFVFANCVLCYIRDRVVETREIKRILKKREGQAYFSIPNVLRNKKDQLAVSKEEWRQLFTDFDVLDQRAGILSLWAVVSTPPGST